jgi:hypothetical protein
MDSLERVDLVPDSIKPAFVLAVRHRSFADDLYRGIGDVVTEDRVIAQDVIRAHDAAQDDGLIFVTEGRLALAFDHKVSIGQDIHNANGDLGDNCFRVADCAAAGMGVVGIICHRGKLAALGQKPCGTGRVKERGDRCRQAGFPFGRRRIVLVLCAAFRNGDRENIADVEAAFIGKDGPGRPFAPERLASGSSRNQQNGEKRDVQVSKKKSFIHKETWIVCSSNTLPVRLRCETGLRK